MAKRKGIDGLKITPRTKAQEDYMILDKQADLINHVWRNCLNSKDGKALFHGDSLAAKYLGEQADWIDAFKVLRDTSEMTINAFYIEGIREKIFQVSINPIYCSPEYQKLIQKMAQEDAEYFLDKRRVLLAKEEMAEKENLK